MDHLYQHLFSSLTRFRIYGDIASDTSTYVALKDDKPVCVLLFRADKNKVHVLNEQIDIRAEEIERFTRAIFARFKAVDVISFHAVKADIRRLPFPRQQFNCTEDIILALPDTEEAYRARLGKATRSYINRYMNKLKRDFPSLRHEIYLKEEVNEQHVRDIIAFNRARMAGKNKASYIDDLEEERIIECAKQSGLVSVMTINGRVCAGTINYRIGENYFLHVIAHDPSYNEYRLGTLCCYLAICECIAQGGREYHFLWGRYEYKYRLLGVQNDLDRLAIYRSRLALLKNGGMALRIAFDGYSLKGRRWLLDQAKQKEDAGLVSRLVFHILNRLRSLRQWRPRLPTRQNREADAAIKADQAVN